MLPDVQAYREAVTARREAEDAFTGKNPNVPFNSLDAVSVSQGLRSAKTREIELRSTLGDALVQGLNEDAKAWAEQVLTNDENSTDNEVRENLVVNGLTDEQAEMCIALRDWFLTDINAHL
jgi:hypothetical protein